MSFDAGFAPIPGDFAIAFASSDKMASFKLSTVSVDKIASAPFGPIPLTVIIFLNISSSSFE